MPKEIRTRAVNRNAFRNYLKKAKEFYQSMEDNYNEERWNACVVNAIHCAISCCDAMTTFYLGVRHAGERHQDTVELLRQIDFDKKEISDKARHFSALISIKSRAEYEERIMDLSDAQRAKKACERFYSWVIMKLG